MSMVGLTIAARAWPAAGQGLAGFWRVARAIRRLIASIRCERRSRGAIGEWRALDDRVLADLGLTRAHIGYAEYAARRGKLPKGWNHSLSR
jgi:uncharacterized protein YjiS (DUF1127 family)